MHCWFPAKIVQLDGLVEFSNLKKCAGFIFGRAPTAPPPVTKINTKWKTKAYLQQNCGESFTIGLWQQKQVIF